MEASELLQKYAKGWRDFAGASLVGADLCGAVLSGVVLSGADLTAARLDGADLRGAEMTRATLCGAQMKFVNLRGAKLSWADLAGVDLLRGNLSGANLRHATLHHANATAATFYQADLSMADLRHADLRETDLTESKLTDADLCKANLTRASLVGAQCGGADFKNARFRETDLTGVALLEVKPAMVSFTLEADSPGPAANAGPERERNMEWCAIRRKQVEAPPHRLDARRAVMRAMHWVTLWTFFMGIAGGMIGCALGSRPDIEEASLYGLAGFGAGAMGGMVIGIGSAMVTGAGFGRRGTRGKWFYDGSIERNR